MNHKKDGSSVRRLDDFFFFTKVENLLFNWIKKKLIIQNNFTWKFFQ